MNITIEPGNRDDFTVHLSSREGAEPFLSIRNCRVVDSAKGRFVSLPAKKLDNGKWFNLVRASDGFQAAVLKVYDKAKPEPRRAAREMDDVPF